MKGCQTVPKKAYLLSFKTEITPAASVGETCEGDCSLSVGLCEPQPLEEVPLGVAGLEELGEVTTDGGYQDCVEVEPSWGRD